MRILEGKEKKIAEHYCLIEAEKIAQKAVCLKSQRGVVIVQNKHIIGQGYNAPPLGVEACIECLSKKYNNKRMCSAIHAEQRAIQDALQHGYLLDQGTVMYHIKLENDEIKPSGKPSCFDCAKSILELGISEFVLMHEREDKSKFFV